MKVVPWTGLAATCLFLVTGDACAAAPPLRQQFIDEYTIARAGVPDTLPDSRELTQYAIYPYLEAARLRRDLSANGAISAFLGAHRGEPVAITLRREWLSALAQRRDWTTFLSQYDGDDDAGLTLKCHALAARLALGRTKGLEHDALEAWDIPESAPAACDPAFDWLKARGSLTADHLVRRARGALAEGESSLARFLARGLPENRAAPLLQWAELIDRPVPVIDGLIENPTQAVEPGALFDGWSRLARRDPDTAAARYTALVEARKLDEATASRYALAVALGLAMARESAGALEFFDKVRGDDFDERAFEWNARAALWAGDWNRVASTIGAMPRELSAQNRWRYWSGRVAEQRGDTDVARELYAMVAPTDNWYAMLASARLGQTFAPTLQTIAFDNDQVAKLADIPGMVRARELYACNLEPEANVEWRTVYDALTPAQQRSAIRLAADWNWYLQSISTAAKQSQFNDYPLLYPRPYDAVVSSAAKLTQLPEARIYAILRQESLYQPDAGSLAGALGLMQLLPSTAQRTARRWDLKPPTRAELLQPEINVPIGAAELRNLIDRFDGQLVAAYAAYNAGPGAARRWLPEQPVETDIWVENIPFNETRAYVQKVAWHSLVYTWLEDRKPVDVTPWLSSVRQPATVADVTD